MGIKSTVYFLAFSLALFNGKVLKAQDVDKQIQGLSWVKEVGAQAMPKGKKIFNVAKYGAQNDGKTLSTKAIQAAIDACYARGGGIVTFQPGAYLTGSIFLKKGVTLQIGPNVKLLGSQDISDYPEINTRVAGIEMKWPAALINVISQDNVAITGKGTVFAQGKIFWDKYRKMRQEYDKKGLRWIIDYDCKRPRTLLISGSSNITVKGITLQQAGFWTVHVLYSKYVTVDGITIQNNIDGHGPSTDGIDLDSSSDILVENCDIDCNDDDFCLKSGRDADGLRVNRPAEYIVIRNCLSRAGGGLLTCGSETSGGIRNVLAQNLKANGTSVGIRLKSAITRGGTVENIYFQNIEMLKVGNAFDITMNWNPSYSYSTLPSGYNYDEIPDHWKVMLQKVPEKQGIPHFRNVYFSNIKVLEAQKAIVAEGMNESPAENFFFDHVNIVAGTAGQISFAKNWIFNDLHIQTKDDSKPKLINCSGLNL
ncbi:MAG: glycoside hydrolase family 28 protein [Bacteroidota bacterium]|nr:glycoside hydrolase family 28 protein [Bacteroidota bacterium]